MQLTGPPKINDWVAPRPSKGSGMDVQWRDASVIVDMRAGKKETRKRRVRGRIRFGYDALSWGDAERLIEELEDEELTITPRTAGAGEDASEEMTLECIVTSDIPTTAELVTGYYNASIELETVYLYESLNPLSKIE